MPKWKLIGPVHLVLNLCFFSKMSTNSLGFFMAMARSSTYTGTYSYMSSSVHIQISCSALHGKKPSPEIQSANLSCHLAPLLRRPYNALLMRRTWPSSSLNSGPAIIYTSSDLKASRYALPMSVAHSSSLFNSAKRTKLNPHRLTTPE
jgi:hypothetical protein